MNWFDFAMMLRPLMLVLMTAIFAGIALWAYTPRRRARLADNALIPLRDDPR